MYTVQFHQYHYCAIPFRRGRVLARIFITGCPNWDFKKLGCPKSLTEKVKIITLIMYIDVNTNK